MQLHRTILVGAGLAITAFVAILMSAIPSSEPSLQSSGESIGPGRLASLQRVQQTVDRSPTLVSTDEPPEEAATSPSPPGDTAPKQSPGNDQYVEMAQKLEAHHASLPFDSRWSDKLRAEVAAALAAQPTGSSVSSAQCAAALCKMSVVHETADAQRSLASHVASLPGLGAGVFYHYEEGAKPPRTVLYIVREGHDLGEMLGSR